MTTARRPCPCRGGEPICEPELFDAYRATPEKTQRVLDDHPERESASTRAEAIRDDYARRSADRILDDLRRQEQRLKIVGR